MKIVSTSKFNKSYKTRIEGNKKLEKRFENRIKLFRENPLNPVLRLHRLRGNKANYYSFSITGDIRAIIKMERDTVTFYDIGTHSQVY